MVGILYPCFCNSLENMDHETGEDLTGKKPKLIRNGAGVANIFLIQRPE